MTTDTESGWKLGLPTGANVTEAQFKSVLASMTALLIRGEFFQGAETAMLDNVRLNVVPEPSTYLAGLSELGMLGLFGWSNRK